MVKLNVNYSLGSTQHLIQMEFEQPPEIGQVFQYKPVSAALLNLCVMEIWRSVVPGNPLTILANPVL